MIVFAIPAVATAGTLQLAADRAVSTHWFNPSEGGDALLWQHIFWFFGHPEVYIIFLPALGFITPIVETFSRRRVFGYTAIVLANITTAFFAFGLWVHHMFATPIPELGQSLFTAASMLIAIPTGVQIFCWLVTMFAGRPRLTTAMIFILGFFFTFVNGGLTGVIVLSVALFIVNAAMSWRGGRLAGANPWDSYGLEWATPSPAPNYNFVNTPVVLGRHPLWDTGSPLPVITGLRADRREVLVTTTFDAQPDHRHHHPRASIWPFVMSLAMGVVWIGSIFSPWAVLGGFGLTLLVMLGWGW